MSTPSFGGTPQSPSLQDHYLLIKERIKQASEKSGRSASDVFLVAVTKKVGFERILEAAKLRIADFGENKVQEAAEKRPALLENGFPSTARHHMIGALQTNKARKAVELFDVIQSVDRLRLAETLDRIAGEIGKKQKCLIEVKISPEPNKSGVPIAEAAAFIEKFSSYKNLQLEGLMTIGMLDASVDETRRSFRNLRTFFDSHKSYFGSAPVLSMGMSDDFETAIEEGSTMVRIGRALFGERK